MKIAKPMTEEEKWQRMMASCRKAANIIGIDFREPPYLDWKYGSQYHRTLWRQVRDKRRK